MELLHLQPDLDLSLQKKAVGLLKFFTIGLLVEFQLKKVKKNSKLTFLNELSFIQYLFLLFQEGKVKLNLSLHMLANC